MLEKNRRTWENSRRHSVNDILGMGIKPSKNLRKFGKHSVAPKNLTQNRHSSPKITDLEEEDDDDDIVIDDSKNKEKSSAYIFTPKYFVIDDSTDYIHENNIMHRSKEIYSAGKQRVIQDHIDYYTNCPTSRKPSFQPNGTFGPNFQNHHHHYHHQQQQQRQSSTSKLHCRNLYHRLGGSIQNLVSAAQISKKFSASDGNLSGPSSKRHNSRLRSRFSRNSGDYCPSVLFNRISVEKRKNSERNKNFSFGKLKSFWNENVLRKRKETNTRKS